MPNPNKDDPDISQVYDVKFYPYTHPDDQAVFAVVFVRSVYVFRTSTDPKLPAELLAVFQDPRVDEYYHDLKTDPERPQKRPFSADASLNSLVWSQDIETGDPLLCFGGSSSGDIKVVNVVKKTFVRSLSGHGGPINDLAVSPLSPSILASASNDFSIRLWNLDKTFQKQPCAAILASPDAHKQPVLALGFHASGKYLLSGGLDTMVNLWPVPDVPDRNAGTDKTTCVHFPLFSSTEVHPNYVDCLCFHGDLILSHAASYGQNEYRTNAILLWKIDGFSSAAPVPNNPPVAKPGLYTRSAFGGRFQRLLTFDMPNTSPFYMRFSLFAGPNHHPILAMGNERSKFSFWDLQALEDGLDDESDNDMSSDSDGVEKTPSGHGKTNGIGHQQKSKAKSQRQKLNESRFDVSDPFRPIAPHYTITVPRYNFAVRQFAWSNCGSWCVAGGQLGIMCIFRRWAEERGGARTDKSAATTLFDGSNLSSFAADGAVDIVPEYSFIQQTAPVAVMGSASSPTQGRTRDDVQMGGE